MIWSIIWWMIKLSVVCIIVAVLASQEGNTEIVWIGWRMDIPTSMLIGSLIIFIFVILWISNLWILIKQLPINLINKIKDKRLQNGYNALAYGLVASSAGDVDGAKKYALQAQKLLDNRDLTEMLSAHAAHLSGDQGAAEKYFISLSLRQATAFHGHLGLMRLSIDRQDKENALIHARKASKLQPRNPKLISMLVNMEAQSKNYLEAINALQNARRIGSIIEIEARQLGAALHTAIGYNAIENQKIIEGQKAFLSALREKPDFIPAVTSLSKIYLSQGNPRKASALLIKIWKKQPHPEIVDALKSLWKESRASSTIAKLIDITDENAKVEARLLIADAALSAGLTVEADSQLDMVGQNDYNASFYQLKSRIAEKNNDKIASNLALENALQAPQKKSWKCNSCGFSHQFWQVSCENCEKVGVLSWQSPNKIEKL